MVRLRYYKLHGMLGYICIAEMGSLWESITNGFSLLWSKKYENHDVKCLEGWKNNLSTQNLIN